MLDKFGVRVEQTVSSELHFRKRMCHLFWPTCRAEGRRDCLRAEGDKEAAAIRDTALVKSEEVLREGRVRRALAARPEKEALKSGAAAHRVDPDFYLLAVA